MEQRRMIQKYRSLILIAMLGILLLAGALLLAAAGTPALATEEAPVLRVETEWFRDTVRFRATVEPAETEGKVYWTLLAPDYAPGTWEEMAADFSKVVAVPKTGVERYRFKLVTKAGEEYLSDIKEVFQDTAVPQMSVEKDVSAALSGVYANRTVYSEATYRFSNAAEGVSGTKYYYSKDGGESYTQIAGNTLTISTSMSDAAIVFYAESGAGVRAAESNDFYDTLTVDATAGLQINDFDGYVTEKYEITFVPLYGESGLGSVSLVKPDGTAVKFGADENTLEITENGRYLFTVTNGLGVKNTVAYDANRIAKEEPVFTVLAGSGGIGGWGSYAEFAFVPVSVPRAGITYYYSVDQGATWRRIEGQTLRIEDNISATVRFRAYTGAGVYYETPTTYTASVDGQKPVVTVTGNPAAWTNKDVILTVDAVFGGSGGTVWYARDGGPQQRLEGRFLTVTTPGVYTFYAVSGANLRSDEVGANVTYLDKTPPALTGAEQGKAYNKDVSIIAEDFVAAASIVTCNGEDYPVDFAGGTVTFTKSGIYSVKVFDAAGNASELVFSIEKPDALLISLVSVLSALLLGAVIFLMLNNLKKNAAIRRLVELSTVSDDPNQFLLYKRIRKGKK